MVTQKSIRLLHLNAQEVEMANTLRLTDETLIRHHKSTQQERWKMNTKDWIRHLYEKSQMKS